jgi:DNA modification methylase
MRPDACVVHHGDCLDVLRGMAEASVDAVVTDPPYGLSDHKPAEVVACLTAWLAGEEFRPKARGGFMNRSWDAWVPGPEVWREVLRVLRPGGHACVFAGARSMDLMSMALRLAGFELRDSIGSMSDGSGAPLLAWVTGQGFPKSLDVGKAIDRIGGVHPNWDALAYAAAVAGSGKTHADVDRHLGLKASSSYWARTDHRACVPLYRHWAAARDFLGLDEAFALIGDEAEREFLGRGASGKSAIMRSLAGQPDGVGGHDITAPATDAAKQWQGFGTALKPSWEPIVLARKPLAEPTVAANVLKHGTGAINVDACRVPTNGEQVPFCSTTGGRKFTLTNAPQNVRRAGTSDSGRWPANLVHDGSPEVLDAFATFGGRKSGALRAEVQRGKFGQNGVYGTADGSGEGRSYEPSTGTAARFFPALGFGEDELRFHYSAKANKQERAGSRHPCVKPQSLLRWLARLITPPNGTILDPFAGSGSLGEAALAEGFSAILIEREAEYYNDILTRLARLRDETPLFAESHAA